VYIKNQFNATASAKALFIARSSFLSRMEQISKLTHVDLDDWKVCLYLMLSYEFYEIDKQ
jgi:DNA-binding PucR family transcriptional regulator